MNIECWNESSDHRIVLKCISQILRTWWSNLIIAEIKDTEGLCRNENTCQHAKVGMRKYGSPCCFVTAWQCALLRRLWFDYIRSRVLLVSLKSDSSTYAIDSEQRRLTGWFCNASAKHCAPRWVIWLCQRSNTRSTCVTCRWISIDVGDLGRNWILLCCSVVRFPSMMRLDTLFDWFQGRV